MKEKKEEFSDLVMANNALMEALQHGITNLSAFNAVDFRLKSATCSKLRFPLRIDNLWQLRALTGDLRFYPDIEPTSKDNCLTTMAHYAAWSGNPEALNWILEHLPTLLFSKNIRGFTIAHFAACSGSPEAVQWIIEKTPELLLSLADTGASITFGAANSGNKKLVDSLIAMGFDANKQSDNGCTILHEAAFSGHVGLMQHLIRNHGINPRQLDAQGNSIQIFSNISNNQSAITFCNDTAQLDELHHTYCASFIVFEKLPECILPEIKNLIVDYIGSAKENNWASVERDIQNRMAIRKEVLKPLIDYCQFNFILAQTNGARKVLNTLLDRANLTINAVEQALERFIVKTSSDKPYYVFLIECRFNTMLHTGNACPNVFEDKMEFLIAGFRASKTSNQALQALQQVHYHFRLKCLAALAAASLVVLAIGIILLCTPASAAIMVCGGALTALANVGSALAALGLYRTQQPVGHEDRAPQTRQGNSI